MMLWVIWDILLPLALAFLAGLFFGWLLWRWRRMKMTSDELAAMRRSSARFKSDADTLRNRNAELAERLRATTGKGDSAAVQDLATANRRIDKLREQLKTVNREHAVTQQSRKFGSEASNGRYAAPQAPRQQTDEVSELQTQLSAARQRIQTLESSVNNAQEGVAVRSAAENNSPQRLSASGYREDEIVVRDKMIATLKYSLEQYGEQQDNTALLAELELRDEKINSLENLLREARRVV